jgi:hypothetical protein
VDEKNEGMERMGIAVLEDVQAYKAARNFLLAKLKSANLPIKLSPEQILEAHLKPDEPKNFSTLSAIYKRSLVSAANRASMPRVIVGALPTKSLDDLSPVLYGFDPHEVAAAYNSWTTLWNRIKLEIRPSGSLREENRSLWPSFSKSVVSSAQFFGQFKDASDFFRWVEFFRSDDRLHLALPLTVAAEIDGIRFALHAIF